MVIYVTSMMTPTCVINPSICEKNGVEIIKIIALTSGLIYMDRNSLLKFKRLPSTLHFLIMRVIINNFKHNHSSIYRLPIYEHSV